jgi:hypothetical protein
VWPFLSLCNCTTGAHRDSGIWLSGAELTALLRFTPGGALPSIPLSFSLATIAFYCYCAEYACLSASKADSILSRVLPLEHPAHCHLVSERHPWFSFFLHGLGCGLSIVVSCGDFTFRRSLHAPAAQRLFGVAAVAIGFRIFPQFDSVAPREISLSLLHGTSCALLHSFLVLVCRRSYIWVGYFLLLALSFWGPPCRIGSDLYLSSS